MAAVPVLTNARPYEGMPPTDRVFDVKSGPKLWGRIRCGGPCHDDYSRINVYVQDHIHYVKLQNAAIESFKSAEAAVKRDGHGPHILVTGHGWRSCADQAALYHSDPSRYADPDVTAHTRGLAIDVDQSQDGGKLASIHTALTRRGWHQVRADEGWHYSFGLNV